MKELHFMKMSGAGNDFIMIDNYDGKIKITPKEIEKICDRHHALGADGVLIVEEPPSDEYDFYMRYYNSDGSEAEMCGNGARCIARFAYIKQHAADKMRFLAKDGEHYAEVKKDGSVKVGMIEPYDIRKNVTVNSIKGAFINTGVPHFVTEVKDITKVDVKNIGREIRFHKNFAPKGTNVDFVQAKGTNVNFVQAKGHGLLIRTYERGVEDETLACGTGAVAAAVIMHLTKNIKKPVIVFACGGELKVHFDAKADKISNVFLEGSAKKIAEGEIMPEVFR